MNQDGMKCANFGGSSDCRPNVRAGEQWTTILGTIINYREEATVGLHTGIWFADITPRRSALMLAAKLFILNILGDRAVLEI